MTKNLILIDYNNIQIQESIKKKLYYLFIKQATSVFYIKKLFLKERHVH